MKKEKIALAANVLLLILETVALGLSIWNRENIFLFYGTLSNTAAWIASLCYLILELKNGKKAREEEEKLVWKEIPESFHVDPIPAWVHLIRYTASCMLAMTSMIVICVLIPSEAVSISTVLLTPAKMLQNLICPLISCISFAEWEDNRTIKKKNIWAAAAVTAVYGLTVLALNGAKIIEGPYPMLMVYRNQIYQTILYSAGFMTITVLIDLTVYLLFTPAGLQEFRKILGK